MTLYGRAFRMFSIALGLVWLTAAATAGQATKPVGTTKRAAAASAKGAVPRLPDGRPNLQGTWDFAQLTPLERPSEFKDKDSVTQEEAEEFAQRRIETTHKDKRDGTPEADVARAYNDFWWDFGTRIAKQPSLVVDPPDGRIPALTEAARERQTQNQQRPQYDNPEERPLAERCILGFNSGPPMVPSAYNNNMQLVQTPTHVMILNEMIHSARIVDMSGRPHRPTSMRFLTGDSIGRWEGDTLVVDTTNFSKERAFRGASANMHLVERFTRVDRDTLRYEFTVDDPSVWTKTWTVSLPMALSTELIYEYACHEGNYGFEGVLKGARYQEKQPPAQK